MFNKSGEEIEDCLNRSDCNVCCSKTMEDEKRERDRGEKNQFPLSRVFDSAVVNGGLLGEHTGARLGKEARFKVFIFHLLTT